MDRRTLLQHALRFGPGAGLAGAALASPAWGIKKMTDKSNALPIVDAHQHLWDLGRFRLPWIAKGSVLDHNFLMSDYLRAAEGLNIVQTIYMEVAVDHAQRE